MLYTSTTDGVYHSRHRLAGKRVRLFARVGRWYVHVEIGSRAIGWYCKKLIGRFR